MTVTFAEKLARMPGYQAGVPTGQAPEAIASGNIAQLASNESPTPPHPKVVEAVAAAAGLMNRYPDPDATLLRRRLAERYETEPARVAVGNGSCEILLAAADALCEPGAEIVYAWPAFSMYPYLPALTGAREVRVPLAEGDVHDLDAMAAEVTAATQLLIVCNPEQPDRDAHPGRRDRRLLRADPAARHGHPRRGLRRVPDPRRPRRDARPARRLPEPRRPAHLQQVLRARRVAGRLRDRRAEIPRRGRRGPPAVQRQRPRPGGRGGGDPPPGRRPAPGRERRSPPGSPSRRDCAASASRTSDTHANFSWIDLGDADEAAVIAGLAEREIAVRPGKALGGPGHIRVSYGTAGGERAVPAWPIGNA